MAETRLGIIGAGGFGLFCLDKCRLIPGVRVTAVADINAELLERLATQYDIPITTTDWRELVHHPEVDVVHIATPPSLHAEQAIEVAKAGKHPFCEKPLAISMQEADAIFAAAEEHGVRVGIDFVMRYSTLYDAVRVIVSERLLGRAQRFLFENNAQDLPAGHWFWNPWLSGGIPVEHGVHFFDIFSSLFGPGELHWAGVTTRPTGEEDKWLIVMQHGERMYGTYYHAFDKPDIIEQTKSEIEFERGRVLLEGWIPERITIDGLVSLEEAERIASILPNTQATALPHEQTQALAEGEMLTFTHRINVRASAGEKLAIYGQAVQDAMADFVRWTQDPNYRPRVTGEDGRTALRVALAATAMAHDEDADS